jgi:hypothetical protein
MKNSKARGGRRFVSSVDRLATCRELPGFKVAGTWRFKKDDIDQGIEERRTQAAKEEGREPRNLGSADSQGTSQTRSNRT